MQVASAPTQVLSPKRLRPASNPPLALTTPSNCPTVVSTLPPVISSHILNNNYLLASQSQAAAAAVANFQHHHPLAPFHHPQHSPILQNLQIPIAANAPLTQIQLTSSSPTATIPTQIPNFIATAQQQQQQIKSINTSSSYNSPSPTVIPISQSVVESSNLTSLSPSHSSTTTVATNTVTNNASMDQVGQMGQNPMQSHPLSQSMDSVNTASNEEEVSHSHKYNGSL